MDQNTHEDGVEEVNANQAFADVTVSYSSASADVEMEEAANEAGGVAQVAAEA